MLDWLRCRWIGAVTFSGPEPLTAMIITEFVAEIMARCGMERRVRIRDEKSVRENNTVSSKMRKYDVSHDSKKL